MSTLADLLERLRKTPNEYRATIRGFVFAAERIGLPPEKLRYAGDDDETAEDRAFLEIGEGRRIANEDFRDEVGFTDSKGRATFDEGLSVYVYERPDGTRYASGESLDTSFGYGYIVRPI